MRMPESQAGLNTVIFEWKEVCILHDARIILIKIPGLNQMPLYPTESATV